LEEQLGVVRWIWKENLDGVFFFLLGKWTNSRTRKWKFK
jgi:hypothetical protein